MKQCTKCKIEKELESFYTNGKGGTMGTCKECYNIRLRDKYRTDTEYRNRVRAKNDRWVSDNTERNKQNRREWARSTATGIYQTIRNSAKRKGGDYISKQAFIQWYESTDKCCEYCGVLEKDCQLNPLLFKLALRLSVDCKDPNLNYIEGNLALSCYACNTIKSNVLTYEEMKEIGKNYISKKIKTC